MPTLPPIPEMRRAYQANDPTYDGLFFLGVKTTGIFCRPVCPARKPLPHNVRFFAHPEEARKAGFRPCKRCKPESNSHHPDWARSLLKELDKDPALKLTEADLERRGLEPGTVRRFFQKQYGMTFQAFCRSRRLGKALQIMRQGGSLDMAALDSGYESTSGFRDAFARIFGAHPAAAKGKACVQVSWVESPLGPLVTGTTDKGICLLEFADHQRLDQQIGALKGHLDLPVIPGDHPHLTQLHKELKSYFAGTLKAFNVPLDVQGTAFQEKVWHALLKIPYGETRSYEEIAISVGHPRAVRAVGTSNGKNRIAIVIPCHRVVNKGGALGGYGGGLRRKEFLLELEKGKGRTLFG